ncbi:hypothetical protein PGT21_050157 [Puccinia graminis f. sp. tritici]|uniref:Tc1-like transposase DDE domain-containing protein n=1 Tax=Puccinia graminis f. sp. tritici TaxID=56615 RepID=A0A5B0Q8X5_PUCGR|nr:hypothetical protein PGT21_050157 [Puccinia graminis f. sp. tritici]KAA1109414.1 hypothetical protein PGTUg99_050170 [Puccinia graminis f. sp. tritici]
MAPDPGPNTSCPNARRPNHLQPPPAIIHQYPYIANFPAAFPSAIHSVPEINSPSIAVMVFVKYARDVKAIVVKMSQDGKSLNAINDTIGYTVSPDSLIRWIRLYRQTADVVRDPSLYLDRGRPLAFTREEAEFVLNALEAEPTLYVDEIQSHIQAMTGTLHPASTILAELKFRLDMTKKVARTVNPAQSEMARAGYVDEIGGFDASYLVFLDECGVSLGTHSRDRAWAPRGRRTQRLPRPLRSSRISVLPAVSCDGLLASIAQEGTMCRLDMEYFIEEVLIPVMNPFPGPNSIIVMDNAAIHHGGRIAEICDAADVLLFYLPPYSPDLNPIEKVFSVLKSKLKRAEILTGTPADAEIIKDFLPTFVTPELVRALFRGCGYRA